MSCKFPISILPGLFAGMCFMGQASAGVIYDENVSGDLPGDQASAVTLVPTVGDNIVRAFAGPGGVDFLDWFAFDVGNLTLTNVFVDSYVPTNTLSSGLDVVPGPTIGTRSITTADIGNDVLGRYLGIGGFDPAADQIWRYGESDGSSTVELRFVFARNEVPEPTTLALLGLGLAGLGAATRRRRPAS